ncbi:hypothetical protein EYF80_001072 [Liparis tanakae]|uniref:Uncharacterized protein n=1 Tax=Liparis tanakae TaxID=230148 RepID=A0A4Z2JEY3_9TELE|nr:hypothetical protein EYF80_001072 [Liparis tanakae]
MKEWAAGEKGVRTRDGVTCYCGEHRAGSERDTLPLIEEASRDQLGALEPEEPYMAREPDVKYKYLKGALQGKMHLSSVAWFNNSPYHRAWLLLLLEI